MISRPLDTVEKVFINMKCYVQLVIELEDEKAAPEFVNKLQKYVYGLHLRADDDNSILHNNKQPVYEIPKGMNDYNQISNWIYTNHTPPIHQALAAVAARDNLVAVNINHLCGDGRVLKILTETLPLPEQEIKYAIPPSSFTLFKDEIDQLARSGLKTYFIAEDPNISRIIPKEKPENILNATGFDVKSSHVSKLVCNNNGKIKGLTESLWTATTLGIAAYNGTLSPCGTATPVDLRPYIKGNFGQFEICNSVGSISVCAEMNPEETVEDLGRKMRQDFIRKNKNNEAFGYQVATNRALIQGNPYPPIPGLGFELSNVGPVKLFKPIKNILMSCLCPNGPSYESSLATFSTISEIPEFNQITTGFIFSNHILSLNDASRINGSFQYALTHIRPEMKIKDALEEIKRFQSQQP